MFPLKFVPILIIWRENIIPRIFKTHSYFHLSPALTLYRSFGALGTPISLHSSWTCFLFDLLLNFRHNLKPSYLCIRDPLLSHERKEL